MENVDIGTFRLSIEQQPQNTASTGTKIWPAVSWQLIPDASLYFRDTNRHDQSVVLSKYLYKNREKMKIKGKRCLELGTGCGGGSAVEDGICAVIQGFSIANQALSRTAIIHMVKEQFKLPDGWRGDDWYAGFMLRRRVDIHVRHPKPLAAKRAKKETLDKTTQFVDQMADLQKRHNFTAETTYNGDESLLHATITCSGEGRIEAVHKSTSNVIQPRGIRYGSVLPFLNAAGHVPLVVIILPLEFGDADTKEADFYMLPQRDLTPHHTKVMYAFTEKGYMTNALFKRVMEEFRRVIKLRHPDLEHLLYLDRLSAHLQPDVVRECVQDKLFTAWLPANPSEFLQPADAAPFAQLHDVLNRVIHQYNPSLIQHHRPAPALVMDFLGAALKECTAANVVMSGFATTGLFPWDRDLILKHVKEFTAPALADASASQASSPLDIARAATLHILDEHEQKAKATKRHVRVSKNNIYLYDQLLDEDEERKKEKERLLKDKERRAAERRESSERRAAEKQQRKRDREALQQERRAEKEEAKRRRADAAATWSCKACARRCRNHRSRDWLWCEYCDTFGICPYRNLCKDGPAVLARHEEEERKRGTRPVLGG